MAENTVKLDIPLLIPGVVNNQDGCLERLERALAERKGIARAHVEMDREPLVLCLHYDPEMISIEDVRRIAERAGAKIANRFHHDAIQIDGVDCSDCVIVLEHSLDRLEGVVDVRVNYTTQQVFIEYNSRVTSRQAIEKRILGLGYRILRTGTRKWYDDHRSLLLSLVCGLLVLGGWLGENFFLMPSIAVLALYLVAYVVGGWDTARHAWQALRMRALDTDILMIAAALGAAFLGLYAEGALLLFLFSLGHSLERYALDRARAAIRSLGQLMPQTALVQNGDQEIEKPIHEIKIGDTVIVRPGMHIPVDGTVSEGDSAVDQSPITGESTPVYKKEGDPVFAGSINGKGVLKVKTSRLAKDSTLARVITLVEKAQAQKSPSQQIAERFTRWFVPAVLIGDLILILIPPLFGVPFSESFSRAMVLLVAASPCALALGAPAAILAGIAQAARNGVLVKGGVFLENLGQLKAIAFDKTGTITSGRHSVTDIFALTPGTENMILALAASIEERSVHPLAQAIRQAADESGIHRQPANNVKEYPGHGMRAEIDGDEVWLGNPEMFKEGDILLPPELLKQLAVFELQGKSCVILSRAHQPLGIIATADVIRKEANQAIAALKNLGIQKVVMLTGDNERVAANIAFQAGLPHYRASLFPDDKVAFIKELVARERMAAMVGDGINDAPALAHAAVGIAMGGGGTDVALEAADVALISDDLSKLPFAVGLGRATRGIIAQNLVIAIGTILLLMTLAITGQTGLGITVAAHEGSTLLVVLNALRLLNYQFRN